MKPRTLVHQPCEQLWVLRLAVIVNLLLEFFKPPIPFAVMFNLSGYFTLDLA